MNETFTPAADDDGASQDLLPIREVARLTGVNPVTLRAWERRYGLILPQRTPKGHRLYSSAQIDQVRQVLAWLDHGVAVSQVKGLLSERQPEATRDDSTWRAAQQQLLEAIEALAERALDDAFNRSMALYPPATLCRHLLLPLLDELRRRWRQQPGARLEQVFFLSWLRSKLGARLYHNNCLHPSAPLLLLNLSPEPMEPGLWLCAWLASDAECPVLVLDWAIPAPELQVALRRIQPRGLLLYGRQSLKPAVLQRLLPGIACPALLCGPASGIHRQHLQSTDLYLTDDPLDALHCLQSLNLLGNYREGASAIGASPCAN